RIRTDFILCIPMDHYTTIISISPKRLLLLRAMESLAEIPQGHQQIIATKRRRRRKEIKCRWDRQRLRLANKSGIYASLI
ncbi:MAG: hypothetical protein WBF33_16445, partial [Candidatus Nitrosopolaris sp.]